MRRGIARIWAAAAAVALAGCGSALIADGDAAMEARDFDTALSKYREARAQGESGDEIEGKIAAAAGKLAAEHRSQAESHERAGRWEAALAAWAEATRVAGNDRALRTAADGARGRAAAAVAGRAEAARAAGNLDAAITGYESARRWAPDDPAHGRALAAALVARAKGHADRRDIRAAMADYAAAVSADGDSVEARDGLALQQQTEQRVTDLVAAGRAAAAKDDFDGAVKAYDEALVLWPGHTGATEGRKAVIDTKAFMDAFRDGFAHLKGERWDQAIAAFLEARKLRQTDELTQRLNEAYRSKWIAEADTAEKAGDLPKTIEALEQAQRYAAAGSAEFGALGERIRKTHYERWMRVGREHEVEKRWKEAAKVYAKIKAGYAAEGDADLIERIIAVEKHLIRVRCDLCEGSGQETKYKLDGERQIPVGKMSCTRCEGTGEEVKVKAGH